MFSYDLPENRIAQRPVYPYDQAKLLIIDRKAKSLSERRFFDLPELLHEKDLLVVNDTQVIPARFFGNFEKTGGAVEVVLLKEISSGIFECLGRPLKRFKEGNIIRFNTELTGRIIERKKEESVSIQFETSADKPLREVMDSVGIMPIPPYIREGKGDAQDKVDYQTTFARERGSIAAPTASLHFTPELIQKIKQNGVALYTTTLHVGAASFLPLFHEHDSEMKRPGVESYRVDTTLIELMKKTKSNSGRVIAVGTTMVRALESMVRQKEAKDMFLDTDLFITPGFNFEAVDAVVTNFHQPRTTHLLLVEALLGEKLLSESYEYALNHNFRFLSYGDGMIIL